MALGSSDGPSLLGDRYELSEVIGQGGLAVVWLALDRVLNRQVAAKVLPAEHDDSVLQGRFFREARHVAALSHPNIVRVFDFGAQSDRSFIIMEYVPGASLRSGLAALGSLSVAETCRVAVDTLAALEHAHEHGVVHRDVKPENLLIDPNGAVKVTDFGIERAFDESSQLAADGTFAGAAGYAAPEQLDGGEVGPTCDLYSLGCVLFECLAGRPPFESDDPQRVRLLHQFAEAPRVSALRSDVPETVSRAITRALAKSPAGRFASANDMSKALEPFAVEDLSATVRNIESAPPRDTRTPGHEARGQARRWPRLSTVVALAAVAIVAATLLVFALTRSSVNASELSSGSLLGRGQSIESPNGQAELVMQGDGNLVAYRLHPKTAIWQSSTSGYRNAYVVMQSDGNLVVYPRRPSTPTTAAPPAALWCSGTGSHAGAVADLQNNGDLVVRTVQGRVLWTAPRDPSACGPATLP